MVASMPNKSDDDAPSSVHGRGWSKVGSGGLSHDLIHLPLVNMHTLPNQ
jgi:hypothetical protein